MRLVKFWSWLIMDECKLETSFLRFNYTWIQMIMLFQLHIFMCIRCIFYYISVITIYLNTDNIYYQLCNYQFICIFRQIYDYSNHLIIYINHINHSLFPFKFKNVFLYNFSFSTTWTFFSILIWIANHDTISTATLFFEHSRSELGAE